MATNQVRRVRASDANLSGNDVLADMRWIDAERLRNTIRHKAYALAPRLVRWGGASSIAGGALWCLTLLLLQLLVLVQPLEDLTTVQVGVRLILVSLWLLLFGMLGLYAGLIGRSRWLSTLGLLLAGTGMLLALQDLLQAWEWPGDTGVLHNIYMVRPLLWWYFQAGPGLVIMSIGLVLLGLAAYRHKVLPRRTALLLSASALLMHAGLPIVSLFVPYYEISDVLTGSGLFVLLQVLFGLSWIQVGRSVLKSRNIARVGVRVGATE